jgi:hypothetical protein
LDKQDATRTWKRTFGFHPLLAFADHGTGGNGESMAELLRPGKAGSNTAVDHVAVFDAALAQVPAELRVPDEHGRVAVLVRTDAAGATKEFAAHLHQARVEFSVGASLGTSTSTPRWPPSRSRRGPRPTKPASPVPPSTGYRSNPATAPGSPKPPEWWTCRRGRPAPG